MRSKSANILHVPLKLAGRLIRSSDDLVQVLSLALALFFIGTLTGLTWNHFAGGSDIPVRNFGAADRKQVEGRWRAEIQGGEAAFSAGDGFYQIVLVTSGSNLRRYSRGVIEVNGDYLILNPRPDFGPPQDSEGRHVSLGSARFPIQAVQKDGRLIWREGPLEMLLPEEIQKNPDYFDTEKMIKRMKLQNPLFKLVGKDFIIWEPD